MKQISDYKYEVAEGETVTFEVTPEGTGLTVKASQNGESIPNSRTSAKAESSASRSRRARGGAILHSWSAASSLAIQMPRNTT